MTATTPALVRAVSNTKSAVPSHLIAFNFLFLLLFIIKNITNYFNVSWKMSNLFDCATTPVHNHWLERALDYAVPLKTQVKSGIFRAAVGYYGRMAITGITLMGAVSGVYEKIYALAFDWYREITPISIAKGFFDITKLPKGIENVPPEKLHCVLKRATELVEQMGISQKVRIYSSEREDFPSGVLSSRLACSDIVIFLNPGHLGLPQESVDSILAHELSHYAHYDIFRTFLFSSALLTIDLAAAYFFGPYAIPLIEGMIANPLEHSYDRMREREADQKALAILNSAQGAIFLLQGEQEKLKKIREEERREQVEQPEKYFNISMYYRLLRKATYWLSKDAVVSIASPSYNNRLDLSHPPLSERIEYIKTFKPK